MTKERFENSWHNVRGVSEEELRGDPEVIRKYGDILNTKWDGVRKHQRANMDVRAAQFSPFAALTGYDDEIRETARITEKEMVLSDDKKEELWDEALGNFAYDLGSRLIQIVPNKYTEIYSNLLNNYM